MIKFLFKCNTINLEILTKLFFNYHLSLLTYQIPIFFTIFFNSTLNAASTIILLHNKLHNIHQDIYLCVVIGVNDPERHR